MKPLEGVRILDLTRLLPGPFATVLMADLGADVVKVEDTGAGDYLRWAPPYYGSDEQQGLGTRSAPFLALNRNKRSIRLDLKSDAGREAFVRLAGDADVVIDGFRPGVMDRLGVGWDVLRERKPSLVYCAITGYGLDGPYVDRAGHDTNYLALGGMLGLTGPPERPVQAAGQIADLGGGALMACFAILAALRRAERSGEGSLLDVSMTDGAQSWLSAAAARWFAEADGPGGVEGPSPEDPPDPPGRGDLELAGRFLCYYPYECADGWVSCGALEPKFWKAFCDGTGHAELLGNQFDQPGGESWERVAAVFRERTKAEWASFNEEHDCCIEPILGIDEALESELTKARGMVIELDQPGIGKVRQIGHPVKYDGRPPQAEPGPAPGFGEHTREVLAAAGYSEAEIESMITSGAAAEPGPQEQESFLG